MTLPIAMYLLSTPPVPTGSMKRYTRRQFAFSIGAALLGASASGCGTILYPERRGQPAGRLDWGVVALDAIGLVFFFVPGVIAFAVDFITGAIYLPYDGYGSTESPSRHELRRIDVPRSQMTQEGIARIVSREAGQPVTLANETCETRQLESLDNFWDTREEIAASIGHSTDSTIVRGQSPHR